MNEIIKWHHRNQACRTRMEMMGWKNWEVMLRQRVDVLPGGVGG